MKQRLSSIDIADLVAQIIGIVIFMVGIAILLFVFYNAYIMFNEPIPGLTDANPSTKLTVDMLGKILVSVLIKLLLLFVMALAGSLIAARGIGLYTKCSNNRAAEQASSEG